VTSRRPAGVEVLNPDLHIASLGKGATLEMEMTVERGVGYRMADKNKKARDPIGVIPVDSIFSPGPQGLLRRREHARRADDRPGPPDPGRRDRRLGDASRGGRLRRRHPARARGNLFAELARPRA
jgi:hypothetical protein